MPRLRVQLSLKARCRAVRRTQAPQLDEKRLGDLNQLAQRHVVLVAGNVRPDGIAEEGIRCLDVRRRKGCRGLAPSSARRIGRRAPLAQTQHSTPQSNVLTWSCDVSTPYLPGFFSPLKPHRSRRRRYSLRPPIGTANAAPLPPSAAPGTTTLGRQQATPWAPARKRGSPGTTKLDAGCAGASSRHHPSPPAISCPRTSFHS